jgi:hypothetical protein
MKVAERRTQERLLGIWRKTLLTLDEIGPSSEAPEDLNAFGEVKDYVLDRVADIEDKLERDRINRRRKSKAKQARISVTSDAKSRRSGNGLPVRDNAIHNASTSGGR